jgi:hypothetical protein
MLRERGRGQRVGKDSVGVRRLELKRRVAEADSLDRAVERLDVAHPRGRDDLVVGARPARQRCLDRRRQRRPLGKAVDRRAFEDLLELARRRAAVGVLQPQERARVRRIERRDIAVGNGSGHGHGRHDGRRLGRRDVFLRPGRRRDADPDR